MYSREDLPGACHFVHSNIIGGITGFLTGGPLGAISGFVAPSLGGGGSTAPAPVAPQVQIPQLNLSLPSVPSGITQSIHSILGGHTASFPGHKPHGAAAAAALQGGPCPPGLFRDVDGECRFPSSPADISVGGAMGGVAVSGRYGAALAPDTESRLHRMCLPGMVLGDDNLCYNRGNLKNSERKYPKGRRPLLTGGDRNAITRAARAARAIQRTEKQLRKLGMLKAPTRRAAPKPRQPLLLPPGSPSIINVE